METPTAQTIIKAPSGYFEESAGQKSSMRLFSFILLLFFIAYHLPFGWANAKAVLEAKPIMTALSDNQVVFDLMVLVFVFVPKAAQKLIELKFGKPSGGTG